MENLDKFWKALTTLKPGVQASVHGDVTSQEDFDKVEWTIGEENAMAIITTTNPHSELTWDLVEAEMIRLQAEYDAQDYARKREAAYPLLKDFAEAYTEKEIGSDTTKWDAYVINYNKTRSDNPK